MITVCNWVSLIYTLYISINCTHTHTCTHMPAPTPYLWKSFNLGRKGLCELSHVDSSFRWLGEEEEPKRRERSEAGVCRVISLKLGGKGAQQMKKRSTVECCCWLRKKRNEALPSNFKPGRFPVHLVTAGFSVTLGWKPVQQRFRKEWEDK